MQKTRKAFYYLSGLVMLAPSIAFAQWAPDNPNYLASNLPIGSVFGIIKYLMMWILGIFGFIGVIGFVISGIMYLTAAGNETQIEKAKKAMEWSLIGVVVGLSGLVIIQAVTSWLDLSMFYF